jgi:hypothetical protein
VDIGFEIEGWYKDPYGRHENRWFSNGRATNLVSDAGTTSHDEPPAEPFDGELVEADEVPVAHETQRVGDEHRPQEPYLPVSMYGLDEPSRD